MKTPKPPHAYRPLLLSLMIAGSLTLSACNDNNDSDAAMDNAAPVAQAGADQSVTTNVKVSLSGAASSDADGDSLTYMWNMTGKPSGSSSALNNKTTVSPNFTPDVAGKYTITVTVSDGTDSTTDEVIVTAANAVVANTTPVANAGAGQTVNAGTAVTLDASGSKDADGDSLTYSWAFTSRPGGSAAALSSATAVKPTFTPDVAGQYVLVVTISDGKKSAAASVTITANAVVVANTAPVANAGVDKNAGTGTLVTLDASGSSDADGDSLTYLWATIALPTGSTAVLSSTTAVKPSFTPDIAGIYTFQVAVNDGTETKTDQVTVTATNTVTSDGSTAGVLCDYSDSTTSESASMSGMTSTSAWICSADSRELTANGLPDHAVGTFPNSGNPNTITAQSVSASFVLKPVKTDTATELGGPRGPQGYVLNGVKIDASTAGSCDDSGTSCSLIDNSGSWSIEALGETSFDFGADDNNAHVQPDGAYHYHGMPEGFIEKQGGNSSTMTLIGWASDGFPIYARYGYSVAGDAGSALKVITGSYQHVSPVPSSRPSTDTYAMGTFRQDWEYVAGSGDLDECNGRTGVTPEFPNGIYHYYATDTYPFFQRCVTGEVDSAGGGAGGPPPR